MKQLGRNSGRWTEARWRTFVRSALRGAFRRWPPRYETLKEAATERKLNVKSGKLAMHYTCAVCKAAFPAKDVQIDHKKPIVDVKKGFESWDMFIEKLFCEAKNLQVLCKPCHKIKSGKERKKRASK